MGEGKRITCTSAGDEGGGGGGGGGSMEVAEVAVLASFIST